MNTSIRGQCCGEFRVRGQRCEAAPSGHRSGTGRDLQCGHRRLPSAGALRRFIAVAAFGACALPTAAIGQPAGIDPAAEKLLRASTDYVAGLKAFSLESRNTLEAVLHSGQKIQFDSTANVTVQRPNRMRAERRGDLVDQVFYYDGKSLTLWNPGSRHFATVAAPDTLEAMFDFARQKLDVVAPGSDFIRKDAFAVLLDGATAGFVVGKSVIAGVRCDHLAFRAPQVDLQIWIEEGARPLPRKVVITSRDMANAPQFEVVVTRWNLAPAIGAGTFTFTPPKGATAVEFMPATAGR